MAGGLTLRGKCGIQLHMVGQMIDGQSYLTAVEAARRLGVSDETIRRWIRLGKLPARKLALQHFILEKDVEELLETRGQ